MKEVQDEELEMPRQSVILANEMQNLSLKETVKDDQKDEHTENLKQLIEG